MLTQIIWLTYFNFILKPFAKRNVYILTLILEILINIALISAFIIFIYDATHNEDILQRMNVGKFLYILYYFSYIKKMQYIGWIVIFTGFAL